jgi:hypothetical protein
MAFKRVHMRTFSAGSPQEGALTIQSNLPQESLSHSGRERRQREAKRQVPVPVEGEALTQGLSVGSFGELGGVRGLVRTLCATLGLLEHCGSWCSGCPCVVKDLVHLLKDTRGKANIRRSVCIYTHTPIYIYIYVYLLALSEKCLGGEGAKRM